MAKDKDLRLDANEWHEAMRASSGGGGDSFASPRILSSVEASNFVQNEGLAHRIVWALPEDAIKPGFMVDGEPAEEWVVTLATIAGGAARARKGAFFWMVLPNEGPEDWANPLPPGPHDGLVVQVLTSDDCDPLTWEQDPAEWGWGNPLLWSISPIRDAMSFPGATVHHTRLAYVNGLRKWPGQQVRDQGFDLSVLDLYRQAIEDMSTGWSSLVKLLKRRAMPWLKLALKRSGDTTANAGMMRLRLNAIVQKMVTSAMIILGPEDDVGWSSPPLSGTAETNAALWQRLSSIEGIPISRLAGTSPGGLSTDDEAGRRAYDSAQERARAAVEPALIALYAAWKGPDDARSIDWMPLNTPTAGEQAAVSLVNAQRDAVLIAAQVLHPDESRARFEDGEESALPVLMELDDVDELPDMSRTPPAEEVPEVEEGPEAAEEIDENG